MFKTRRVVVASAAMFSTLVSLVSLLTVQEAIASKGGDTVEAKTDNPVDSGAQTARFGAISASASTVVIVAESAKVVVKRVADISEIQVSSNCPRNWAVKGSQIRQAGFSGEIRKGTALLADDLGSRAIVNGKVYLLPSGPMKGLSMGAEGVKVGGQPIDPLKGSDIPCNCSGTDLLEVSVPQTFTGDLRIGSGGKSQIVVDSWKDGALECVMLGESSLSAGKLESSKVAFDNKGKGAADISEVDAKIFVVSTRGSGNASIRVKKGKSEMSNFTVEGNGTIELHGTFKKMQKLVDGTGKIEVKE